MTVAVYHYSTGERIGARTLSGTPMVGDALMLEGRLWYIRQRRWNHLGELEIEVDETPGK